MSTLQEGRSKCSEVNRACEQAAKRQHMGAMVKGRGGQVNCEQGGSLPL